MKKLMNLVFLVLVVCQARSQTIGGSESSDPTPHQLSPGNLESADATGNVDLFRGTYHTSYSLGRVSTPSGLNFNLNLNYQAAFNSGDIMPTMQGVPYGEGWSLGVPTITIESEDFHTYNDDEEEDIALDIANGKSHIYRENTSGTKKAFSNDEGRLFWFSPKVNIPGVVNARLIYKYTTQVETPDGSAEAAVFIPQKFEPNSYCEAYLVGGMVWYVKTADGTWYEFGVPHFKRRNPNASATLTSDIYGASSTVKSSLYPIMDFTKWYCSEISNLQTAPGQRIRFYYNAYGRFNFFAEFLQLKDELEDAYGVSSTTYLNLLNNIFIGNSSASSQYQVDFSSYQELFLAEVRAEILDQSDLLKVSGSNSPGLLPSDDLSAVVEKLELEYSDKSGEINAVTGTDHNLLLTGANGVEVFDDLYNSKVVYEQGGQSNFTDWQRYHNIFSSDVQGAGLSPYTSNLYHSDSWKNPYLSRNSGNSEYYLRSNISNTSTALDFNHCFLESPRIGRSSPLSGISGKDFPSGDLYEIQADLNSSSNELALYDLRVVTGRSGSDATSIAGGTLQTFAQSSYDETRGSELFSTMNKPVKWSTSLDNSGSTTASVMFMMPNTPIAKNGFHIQVGPANTNMDYTMHPNDIVNASNSAQANYAYYGNFSTLRGGSALNVFGGRHVPFLNDKVFNHFGSGHPWAQVGELKRELVNHTSSKSNDPYLKFWHRNMVNENPDHNWTNNPTTLTSAHQLGSIKFIRYSKKPMLLTSVSKYVANTDQNVKSQSLTMLLLNEVNLAYTYKKADVLENKYYQDSDIQNLPNSQPTINGNEIRVYALLSQVKYVGGQEGTAAAAKVYDFSYKNGIANRIWTQFRQSMVNTSFFHLGAMVDSVFPLQEIVDDLGNIKTISYNDLVWNQKDNNDYNFTGSEDFYTRNYESMVTDIEGSINSTNKEYLFPPNMSFTIMPTVKSINTYVDGGSKDQLTSFSYNNFAVVDDGVPAQDNMKKYFREHHNDYKLGYKNVVVTLPDLNGETRTIEYSYRSGEINFGRLKSITHKTNGRTLKEKLYTYKNDMVFENGLERSVEFARLLNGEYYDYDPNNSYTSNDPRLLEIETPYEAKYLMEKNWIRNIVKSSDSKHLNSYFVKLEEIEEHVYDSDASNNLFTTNFKQFEYYEADHTGETNCEGFRKILNDNSASLVQLRFEPSWQLYKMKEIDGEKYSETENFYYYDLMNEYVNWTNATNGDMGSFSDSRPHEFRVMMMAHHNKVRNLLMERRVSSDMEQAGKHSIAEYFLYEMLWGKDSEKALRVKELTGELNGQTESAEEPDIVITRSPNGIEVTQEIKIDDVVLEPDEWFSDVVFKDTTIAEITPQLTADYELLPLTYNGEDLFSATEEMVNTELLQTLRNEIDAIVINVNAVATAQGKETYDGDLQKLMLKSAIALKIAEQASEGQRRMERHLIIHKNNPQDEEYKELINEFSSLKPGTSANDAEVYWTQNSYVFGRYSHMAADLSTEYSQLAEVMIYNAVNTTDTLDPINYLMLPSGHFISQEYTFAPLWLSKHYIQIHDDHSGDYPGFTAYNADQGAAVHSEPILRFDQVQSNTSPPYYGHFLVKNAIPLFPFDVMCKQEILTRNEFGNPTLSHNWRNSARSEEKRGILTRYDFKDARLYKKIDFYGNYEIYKVKLTEVNKVQSITDLAFESNLDSLTTEYDYNDALRLKSVTDPNGIELSYTYDVHGGLVSTKLDNQTIEEFSYNTWDNENASATDDFDARALYNYTELTNYFGTLKGVKTRSYVDPLGRSLQSVSTPYSNSAANQVPHVYSGVLEFDQANRIIKGYDQFSATLSSQNMQVDLIGPSQWNSMEMDYEDNTLSKPLKSSVMGKSLNDKFSESEYTLVNRNTIVSDLNLSPSEELAIMPCSACSYVFKRVKKIDPDGKWITSYYGSFNQKVASIQQFDDNGSLEDVTTLYYYNNQGLKSKTIHPSKLETSFDYNLLGWKIKETTADKGTTRWMYSRTGAVVLEQEENFYPDGSSFAGQAWYRKYDYDRAGRLIKVQRIEHEANTTGSLTDALLNAITSSNEVDALLMNYSDLGSAYTFSNLDTYAWKKQFRSLFPTTNSNFKNFLGANAIPEKEWVYSSDDLSSYGLATSFSLPLNHNKGKVSMSISYQHLESGGGTNVLPVHYGFFEYDGVGNLITEVQQFNEDGITAGTPGNKYLIQYGEHNLAGTPLIVSLDSDFDGNTDYSWRYNLDDWGRAERVLFGPGTIQATDLQYTKAIYNYYESTGQPKQLLLTQNNGLGSVRVVDTVKFSYDARKRLTNIETNYFEENLFYDSDQPTTATTGVSLPTGAANYNGNVNGITYNYKLASFGGGTTFDGYSQSHWNYSYDELNRLVDAESNIEHYIKLPSPPSNASAIGDADFKYDVMGNIKELNREMASGSQSLVYSYQANTNRLSQVLANGSSQWDYLYDDNGNVTSSNSDNNFSVSPEWYGIANLPFKMNDGVEDWSYLYNSTNTRIFKHNTTSTQKEFYLASASGQLLGIHDMLDNEWDLFVNGTDKLMKYEPAANGSPEKSTYFVHDHLGNMRLALSADASITNLELAMDYFPFGKNLRAYNAGTQEKFLTTGNERDQETGLDYRNARFYDSDLGRFLNVDPMMEHRDWLSPYNYVQNMPIVRIDPSGLIDQWKITPDGRLLAEEGDNILTLQSFLLENYDGDFNIDQLGSLWNDLTNWDGTAQKNGGIVNVKNHTLDISSLNLSKKTSAWDKWSFYADIDYMVMVGPGVAAEVGKYGGELSANMDVILHAQGKFEKDKDGIHVDGDLRIASGRSGKEPHKYYGWSGGYRYVSVGYSIYQNAFGNSTHTESISVGPILFERIKYNNGKNVDLFIGFGSSTKAGLGLVNSRSSHLGFKYKMD